MGGNFFTGYTPDMRFLPGSAQAWLDQLYMGGDFSKSKGAKFSDRVLSAALKEGDFTKNPFFGMRNAELAGNLKDIERTPSFLLGPVGNRVQQIREDEARQRVGSEFGNDVAQSTFQAAGLSEQSKARINDEKYRRQYGALSLYPGLMYNASARSQGFLGGLVNSLASGAAQVGAAYAGKG